jgi:hypothetical protein
MFDKLWAAISGYGATVVIIVILIGGALILSFVRKDVTPQAFSAPR